MIESEMQPFFDVIEKKQSEINELKKELLEVYTCLYPEWGAAIEVYKKSLSFMPPEKVKFIVESAALDIIRDSHKEKLKN